MFRSAAGAVLLTEQAQHLASVTLRVRMHEPSATVRLPARNHKGNVEAMICQLFICWCMRLPVVLLRTFSAQAAGSLEEEVDDRSDRQGDRPPAHAKDRYCPQALAVIRICPDVVLTTCCATPAHINFFARPADRPVPSAHVRIFTLARPSQQYCKCTVVYRIVQSAAAA